MRDMVSTNPVPTPETRTKKTWMISLIILSSLVILYLVNVDVESDLKSRLLRRKKNNRRGNPITAQKNDATKKRIAIVRPFCLRDYQKMMSSFDNWDNFLPCDNDSKDKTATPYVVDLILSFSQTFSSQPDVAQSIDDFKKHLGDTRWPACFNEVKTYEAQIPAERDIYTTRTEDGDMWVNGPNRHFGSIFRHVEEEGYESFFLMESDVIPNKNFWMDNLLWEADEKSPFAILGSKYDGFIWGNHKKTPALQKHINGNAFYNVTHPYMKLVIAQLESEAEEGYNSQAFDYRISQIVHEGSHGIVTKCRTCTHDKFMTQKFREWWMPYGKDNPYKESQVISNLARSSLLPEQVKDISLLHNAHLYAPWNPQLHAITLVVSERDDKNSDKMLSGLESSRHPFSEVTLMVPTGPLTRSQTSLKDKTLTVNVYERKTSSAMDLCEASVSTEWFMLTDSYHIPRASIDLYFTNDNNHKPVIPVIPAFGDKKSCNRNKACRETLTFAKKIYPKMNFVIQDSDMLFHSPDRDAFCNEWASKYQHVSPPMGTAYLAYLFSIGKANDLYDFRDQVSFGSKRNKYVRISG